MNTEKLKEVFSDEAFVKGLFELESAAQVQAALKEKGVEMSEDEILAVRELLIKVEKGEVSAEQLESGELPEELLEQVAGGATAGNYVLGGILSVMMPAVGAASLIIKAVEDRW